MIKEFEGKTEEEAIEKAIEELNLNAEDFDVEILESEKKGFIFKKGNVKIRVHVNDEDLFEPECDFEESVLDFVEDLIEKMGFPGDVGIISREENKITCRIDSEYSAILIGKKGKNLDAIQLLANVYAGKRKENYRIIVDTENYRSRKEDRLIRLARRTAAQVRKTRSSRLLEPMNPFERRLIHTTLNEFNDVETKSEGEGLYKQVRIFYTGSANGNHNY